MPMPRAQNASPVAAARIATRIESTKGRLLIEVDNDTVGHTPVDIFLQQEGGKVARDTKITAKFTDNPEFGTLVARPRIIATGESVPRRVILEAINLFDQGTPAEAPELTPRVRQ